VSCDQYSDLWKPFFSLFWRFWPDCPFNVYLLSNKISADIPRVATLLTGEDVSWSDNLRKGIERLEEEYILLFIEDLFLHDFVCTDEVLQVVNRAIENKANYLRMNPLQRPDKPYDELIGIVSKGTIYRSSVVMSIWRKTVLLNLLKSGETAWDFEIYGSIRSDDYDGFYSTWENQFPTINGVIKGEWRRDAVKKCRSLGVEIDLTKRTVMNPMRATVFSLKRLRTKLLNLFPARHRRKIKDFILRGRYNYEQKI
jgi:hypothetical protein